MKKYFSPELKLKMFLNEDVMEESNTGSKPELGENDTPWDEWVIGR